MNDLPKRKKERFGKGELELMLTLKKNKGMKPAAIALALNEKFGTERSPQTVYCKLRQIIDNGIPKRLQEPVEISYEVPDSATQAMKQFEIAFRLLANVQQFLHKVDGWEADFIATQAKIKQMKIMVGADE